MITNDFTDKELLTIKSLIDSKWRSGDLKWKLKPHQLGLYNEIVKQTGLKHCVVCTRRFGKSYILVLISNQKCLKEKNVHVRFAAPTQRQLKEIIIPILNKIHVDCPIDIKPIYRSQDSCFYFPSTGSYLHLAGCENGHMENLRGHESHLNIIDEAGSIDDLEYLIKDILLPQTLTTKGKMYIASTPPPTPAHYFHSLAMEAKRDNYYSIYTIDDNSSIDDFTKQEYAKESGGINSSTWKREYLCQFVVDEKLVIIPEWKNEFVKNVERDDYYKFYDCYSSMDIGGRDKTVVNFGFFDFKRSQFILEHELVFTGQETTTKLISDKVKEIESLYYPDKKVNRWSDNNAVIFLQDMGNTHGVYYNPTSKDLLQAMINELRIFIDSGRLIINPRCTETIGCLETGIWDKTRQQFQRSGLYGHFDALAALVYLVRNLNTTTNPIPKNYGLSLSTHYIYSDKQESSEFDALKGMMK